MEYMDGGSLRDRLDANPNGLPVDEALWIGECLCKGVKLAHDNGVVHLDLKPENVLFRETPRNSWDVPKIADWGLSRRLSPESRGVDGFSIKYAAPEQLDADAFDKPDTYTDIYQVGAIIYEMLTGQPPFTGGRASIEDDVVSDVEPNPPISQRESIPAAADDIVLKALSIEKPQRYRGSIDRLEDAIREIRRDNTAKSEQEISKPVAKEDTSPSKASVETNITVVGIGGAGGNTVTRMMEEDIDGPKFVAASADAQHLADEVKADTKILIGKNRTGGRGSGSVPKIGEEAAQENIEEIQQSIDGSDMVLVTAGLGGGTGSGAAPVIAQAAQEAGALTISIVTLPFTAEGERRRANADAGLERLRSVSDTVIVVPNDLLLDYAPSMPLQDAFKVCDSVLMRVMKGMNNMINTSSLVNIDFADVRTVMENGGVAMVGFGGSDSDNRTQHSIHSVPRSPLPDMAGNSALVSITGGPNISAKEAEGVVEKVYDRIGHDARIVWGASVNPELEGEIETMEIVTGIESPKIYGRSETEDEELPKEFNESIDHIE